MQAAGLVFVLLAVFAGLSFAERGGESKGTIKVASVGWTVGCFEDEPDAQSAEGYEKLFAQPVRVAAKAGAKLIVSPETGFYTDQYDKVKWFEWFGETARENGVYLAVGYFDGGTGENRFAFVSPKGVVMAEYAKRHLTVLENFKKGDGRIKVIEIDGVKVSGMICHDDNFTDLSRQCELAGVKIAVVPTLDWAAVKNAHFQGSIHRAIESRYAIVRAAINGISAVISARGEVIAEMDHVENGAGYVVAEIAFN